MSASSAFRVPDVRLALAAAFAPASARRFLVRDPMLAAALAEAGASLDDRAPDVEIGSAATLGGAAETVIVPLSMREPDARLRGVRGVQRGARAARLEARTRQSRKRLEALGYEVVPVASWSRSRPLRRRRERASDLLLLQRAVVGRRGTETSFLEEALAAGSAATGRELRPERILFASSGVVTAVCDHDVLRVGLGAARFALDSHFEAAAAVGYAAPTLAALVPEPRARGEVGLAGYSVESRLPGARDEASDGDATLAAALGFLESLAGAAVALDVEETTPVRAAAVVGSMLDPARAARLAALGEELGQELADLPSAFAHGDFWEGNLLWADGRLVGVLDWRSAGPRKTGLDALHLDLSLELESPGRELGPVVADRLVRQDPVRQTSVRTYLERTAGRADEALLLACWLDAAARELLDPDRVFDPATLQSWRRTKVHPVLDGPVRAFFRR